MRGSLRQGSGGWYGQPACNFLLVRCQSLINFVLANSEVRRQTGAMKTPSRTFVFLILAIIVTLAVVSCATFQFVANQQALLYLGGETTYAEWKSQSQFDDALARVCKNGGYYDLTVLVSASSQPIHPYKPCAAHPVNIRMVSVTKSKVADRKAAAEPAAGDPNAMHKVASASIDDIRQVVDALK